MIISFAWTTPVLAGAKTVTRRDWLAAHGSRFHPGDLVDAWDRSPRANGKKVATIRITRAPYLQSTRNLPEDQYHAEGFSWLVWHGTAEDRTRAHTIWEDWRDAPRDLWVVEFELVERVA